VAHFWEKLRIENLVTSPVEEHNTNSGRHEAKRIAVVTVHGVGDQEPGGTVRAIGDLLLNFIPGSYEWLSAILC
jgi:hypothetical protein